MMTLKCHLQANSSHNKIYSPGTKTNSSLLLGVSLPPTDMNTASNNGQKMFTWQLKLFAMKIFALTAQQLFLMTAG